MYLNFILTETPVTRVVAMVREKGAPTVRQRHFSARVSRDRYLRRCTCRRGAPRSPGHLARRVRRHGGVRGCGDSASRRTAPRARACVRRRGFVRGGSVRARQSNARRVRALGDGHGVAPRGALPGGRPLEQGRRPSLPRGRRRSLPQALPRRSQGCAGGGFLPARRRRARLRRGSRHLPRGVRALPPKVPRHVPRRRRGNRRRGRRRPHRRRRAHHRRRGRVRRLHPTRGRHRGVLQTLRRRPEDRTPHLLPRRARQRLHRQARRPRPA